MYDYGKGVSKDKAKAVQLYKEGCDGGDASGCVNLGYMYDNDGNIASKYRLLVVS